MKIDPPVDSEKQRNTTRALRVMFTGSRCLGVFAEEIEAIADWRTPTPLPEAPAGVLGVVCIRGRMLTMFDAAVLLGESAAVANRKLVALRGDEQLALAVDRTGELIEVAPDELKPPSEKGLIIGVVSPGDHPIAVLDRKQLFATGMRGRERRRRHF